LLVLAVLLPAVAVAAALSTRAAVPAVVLLRLPPPVPAVVLAAVAALSTRAAVPAAA